MISKLMMRLIVASETVFFISLILAYLFFWRSGHFQSAVNQYLDIKKTTVFTIVLISSSLTFILAERSYLKGRYRLSRIWIWVTIFLGLIFLAGQGLEYAHLLQNNISISHGEFGSSFFALTGFHVLHVLIGIVLLAVLLILLLTGYFPDKPGSFVSTVGIYWHFVDIVWLSVFTVIYLLPYLL